MRNRCVAVVVGALTYSLLLAPSAYGQENSVDADIITVDLPNAPTLAVAVQIAGRINVGGVVCDVSGAPWAHVLGDDAIEVDRARFAPGWLNVRVAARGSGRGGCAKARALRMHVGRGSFAAALNPGATVLPESGVVELTAAALDGFAAVVTLDGVVENIARCLGKRTCVLPLDASQLPDWLLDKPRRKLLLWPAGVALTVGGTLPALHDGVAWVDVNRFAPEAVRYELRRPLLAATRLDGSAERTVLPLAMPEAVASVSCKFARCALSSAGIEVYAVDDASLRVQIKLELRPEANRIIAGRSVGRETFNLEVVRCVIRLPQDAPLLGGVQDHGYAVAVSRDCLPTEIRDLEVRTFPPTRAWIRGETRSQDRAFRVFEIAFDKVPDRIAELELTLRRAEPIGTTLAAARIAVAQDFQPIGVRLEVDDLGQLDFVPRNRVATLHTAYANPRWLRDISIIDRPGFYVVSDNGQKITGATAATGSVPLRLAYAPASVRKMLRRDNPIAVFDTIARYPVRTLNVPLPLARPNGVSGRAIVRVSCRHDEEMATVRPGRTTSIAFEDRFGCRLVIDRSQIPAEAGEQRLRVKAPGLDEVITVSKRPDQIELAITVGDREEFAVIHISVAHEYTGAHYDFSPRQSLGAEASWHIVLGDRSFRISVGTALPTGLFRFGSDQTRGAVAFSAGGLARFHWLYKEGREFPIGLDLGVLGTGLSNDPQLSFVTGLGFSVPVLNANTNLQASFNLHAWLEYALTRDVGRWAFMFGPSFAIGKFSTNL